MEEAHKILGEFIWSLLPAKFAEKISELNPKDFGAGTLDFVRWDVDVSNTAANIGLFDMTDIFKSREMVEILLSTVSLWNCILEGSSKMGRMGDSFKAVK